MSEVIFFFGGWAPVLRIIVVGTLAYSALLALQRISGKRTLGQMNAFDLLITVALGASFGRILTARDVALIEAVTAFALLMLLQLLVAVIRQRSQRAERVITASPTVLFYRGDFLRGEMKKERVSDDELAGAVRQSGLGSFQEVEAILLEADGKLAVITAAQAGNGNVLPSQGS
ncbi:MAG: DUF421 domain-containing protein [Pseudorhizobium sp.]